MTEPERQDGDEFSLYSLATTLLRHRWRIVTWMLVAGALALLVVFLKPVRYEATASFVTQGNDGGHSGLASLAGQFGVSLPAGNQSLSPDFYAKLMKSRVLLRRIAADTFVVPELGRQRVSFADLFKIREGPATRREEQAVVLLQDQLTKTSVSKLTGIVELSVITRWPSVSLAIATALVSGLNDFNRGMIQGQASTERVFVEGRLGAARAELRAAEDRLEEFLKDNRELGGSPQLNFQRERLMRDMTLKQQVFTTLSQSYEEVRMREVRDIPVITVIEAPSVRASPQPAGRLGGVILGLLLGGFFGVGQVLVFEAFQRRRREGDPKANEFISALSEVKDETIGRFRRSRGRV